MKKILNNRIFIGIAAILLALLIVFLSAPIAEIFTSGNVEVIRAKQLIKTGTKITSEQIETISVGKFNLPTDIVILSQDVIDNYAKVDMFPGDYILSSKISEINGEYLYLSDLEDGKMAISISLDDSALSLSSKLRANDIISIFSSAPDIRVNSKNDLSIEDNYRINSAVSYGLAFEDLKYVKILAVVNVAETDIITDKPSPITTDTNSSQNLNTITNIVLQVNARQAQLLAGINDKKLHCALVHRGSDDKSKELLQTQDDYFNTVLVSGEADE